MVRNLSLGNFSIHIVSQSDAVPEWRTVSEEIIAKAKEICSSDGMEPDMMTEDGYGPGYSEDGNHTTAYAESQPFWSLYIDDAIKAIKHAK